MSLMPEYEFRVLCADNQKSCNFVKGLMNEFSNVCSVDSTKPYDHTGTINVKSSNEALKKKRELKLQAGDSVRNIEIALI